MEIRLTLEDPEKAFMRRRMFETEKSARAVTLDLIQTAMRRASKDAPALIRKSARK